MDVNLVRLFTDPLAELGLPYMVTGSVASIAYGDPRLTNDVDLVVVLAPADAAALTAAFPLDDFYCPPQEVLEVECARSVRGHFNLIHHETGFKADVYPAGDDPLHRWALARRRELVLGEAVLWVAPPEYVIVRKLQFLTEGGSSKHARDIRGMLAGSADLIDRDALHARLAELGLMHAWDDVTGDRMP